MIQDGLLFDRNDATPLDALRAITDTNARAARRVFELASLSYVLVLIGLFSVAFLHDAKMAKLSLLASSPFVVAVVITSGLIFRGLPARIGAWTMLISTNVTTTIVTILMGGLAYHSLPLLFFTLSLIIGFFSLRDAMLSAFSSFAAILLIAWATTSVDPWTQIEVTGEMGVADIYLISYLCLLFAFCLSAWINVDVRRAQERRVIEALKRAEHAGVEKSKLFSLISHEMRTPLNGLIGLSAVLIATGSSEAVKTRAKVISDQARNLADAINRVLEMIEKNSIVAEPKKKPNVYGGKLKLRGAEIVAISYALFFTSLIAVLFTFDLVRAETAALASLPFAAMIWVTPVLIRRGMEWRVALMVLSWTSLGAVTVMCIAMGGLAFPITYFILVLPAMVSTRGDKRDIGRISIGCFAAIVAIHFFTSDNILAIPEPSISPPSLSWVIVALTSLVTFVYSNWASLLARMKRISALKVAVRRAETVDEAKALFSNWRRSAALCLNRCDSE